MENFEKKSLLMGGLSFLAAVLVVLTLLVSNGFFNKEKVSSLNQKLNQTKTAAVVFDSDILGDFSVCSYNKTSAATGMPCNTTDTATIWVPYAGTFQVLADIERGCETNANGSFAPQMKENFTLSVQDATPELSSQDDAEATCVGHKTTQDVALGSLTFASGGQKTVTLTHADQCSDTTGTGCTPESVTVKKLKIKDANADTCTLEFTDADGISKESFNAGEKIYAKININNGNPGVAKVYSSCGTPSEPNGSPEELDEATIKTYNSSSSPVQIDDSADAGGYWCVVNIVNDFADEEGNSKVLNPTFPTGNAQYTCGDSATVAQSGSGDDTCQISFVDSSGKAVTSLAPGATGKMKWTASIGQAASTYYSCFYGDDYAGTKLEGQVTGSDGEVSLTNISSTKTGAYYCVMSLFDASGNHLNKDAGWGATCAGTLNFGTTTYSCTGTTPSNATLCSGDDTGLTADTAKSLASACTDTAKCEYTCNSGYSYDSTTKTCKVAATPTCWMKASNSSVTIPSSGSATSTITWGSENATTAQAQCTGPIPIAKGDWPLNMSGSPYPDGYPASFPAGTPAGTEKCSMYLDGSSTEACSVSILVNATYSCTGTTPTNSSICSGDGDGLTANVAKSLVSACTTATKCEYTCNSGYAYSDGSCVAETNGSCGSASKTYSYSSTSFGTDTFCTSGTASPSSPTFPSVGSSTSWTCQGSNGGVNSSCKASRSSEVINGSCGDLNGDSLTSKPSSDDSDLCSAGNESSISGDGPWYWTCEGVNGGSSESCSASKITTTTSVIPVTEYTYSYTSKVAPASGVATNVALLLSVSAAVTLGVWLVMKKIKG